MDDKTTFLIIDGNSIGFRASSAKPQYRDEMKTSDGRVVGTIYRFFNMLNKVLNTVKPTHLIVCFDTPGKTFRHDIDSSYKANRIRTTDKEAIYEQFLEIRKIFDLIGIKHDNVKMYEGDDLIGTYLKMSKADNNYILSGDKDVFQLISDNATVLFPIKGVSDLVYYDKEAFKNRFDIDVEDYISYKALVGDEGDNIQGVQGVGEKTAGNLLAKFKSVDNIMNNLNTEQKDIRGWKRIRNNLSQWDYKKTLELVTIVKDCPINNTFEECKLNLKWDNALTEFEKLEFNTFVKKVKEEKFYNGK